MVCASCMDIHWALYYCLEVSWLVSRAPRCREPGTWKECVASSMWCGNFVQPWSRHDVDSMLLRGISHVVRAWAQQDTAEQTQQIGHMGSVDGLVWHVLSALTTFVSNYSLGHFACHFGASWRSVVVVVIIVVVFVVCIIIIIISANEVMCDNAIT